MKYHISLLLVWESIISDVDVVSTACSHELCVWSEHTQIELTYFTIPVGYVGVLFCFNVTPLLLRVNTADICNISRNNNYNKIYFLFVVET